MEVTIAIGEAWAGLAYVLAGAGFIILDAVNNDANRSIVKIIAGALLIVAGLEELADAFVTEGAGNAAIAVQALCTFAQVAINTVACRAIYLGIRYYT